MAFFSLLLYITCIYIRPQEWVSAIYGIPLVNITALLTVILFFLSKNRKIVVAQQNYVMIWFLLALVISHLSHLYFSGALIAFQDFFKTIIMYFLIVNIVTTHKRFKIIIDIIILLTLILAIQGIMQYHTGVGLAGQFMLTTETIPRITWIGLFSDPNDLALGFVIVIPFLFKAFVSPQGIFRKLYSAAVLCVLVYALFLTNSRGGMLALGAVLFSYVFIYMKRKGKMVSGIVISLILIGAVLAFGPSRMGDISPEDESAHGRIDAWYSGIQMLKSSPIFGVGYNMFTEHHFRTAHNSIILCVAETGLFGYLIWVALFYFSFRSLIIVAKAKGVSDGVIANAISLQVALIGFLAAAFFLSRTYNPLPYMLIAFSVVVSNIEARDKLFSINDLTSIDFRNIILIGFITLVCTYAFVRFTI